MLFELDCSKTVDEIDVSLREAAKNHRFGVLGVHDLEQTLEQKGLPINMTCRVYEICNPQQAKQVLQQNGSFSSLLPCRVAVYGSGEKLRLSTVLPTGLFSLIGDERVHTAALAVEEDIKAMMRQAAE
jgi:uncharacterized protein (DUF302 family)